MNKGPTKTTKKRSMIGAVNPIDTILIIIEHESVNLNLQNKKRNKGSKKEQNLFTSSFLKLFKYPRAIVSLF